VDRAQEVAGSSPASFMETADLGDACEAARTWRMRRRILGEVGTAAAADRPAGFDPLADGVVGSPRSGRNCAPEEPAAHTDPTVSAPAINGERDLGEGAPGEFHRVALAAGFPDNGRPASGATTRASTARTCSPSMATTSTASMAACTRAG
jgi:hypothetical protein